MTTLGNSTQNPLLRALRRFARRSIKAGHRLPGAGEARISGSCIRSTQRGSICFCVAEPLSIVVLRVPDVITFLGERDLAGRDGKQRCADESKNDLSHGCLLWCRRPQIDRRHERFDWILTGPLDRYCRHLLRFVPESRSRITAGPIRARYESWGTWPQVENIRCHLNRLHRCFQSLLVSRSEKLGERAPIQSANS
jgi:hypothetical protein